MFRIEPLISFLLSSSESDFVMISVDLNKEIVKICNNRKTETQNKVGNLGL